NLIFCDSSKINIMIVKYGKKEIQSYLEDTSNLEGVAFALYLPQTQQELVSVIKNCVKKREEFTVSGGRTGATGGCIPQSGVVIALDSLNKIISIDQKNRVISLQSGATQKILEEEANKYNLTFNARSTEELASIGGVISTAASGVRGFKYGSIRDYVVSIEVILPTGTILNIKRGQIFAKGKMFDFEYEGNKYKFELPSYNSLSIKSQAGYFVKENMDLIDLFIGTEGTLGVIASCTIKLDKLILDIFDGVIFFQKEDKALDFVEEVKRLKSKKELDPTILEFFDSNSLDMLRSRYSFVPETAGAAIYFEQEVGANQQHSVLFDKWIDLMGQCRIDLEEVVLADTADTREKVFKFRHNLPQLINERLRRTSQVKTATDIAVPDNHFREMYKFYKKKADSAAIARLNFGHIGESHLHFNFLPSTDSQAQAARALIKEFCEKAVSLGGTVSAEHGIGKVKKPYLKIMYSDKEIKEMAALKKYFDPNWLLGVGNILDKEDLG
ncbi:MAG: FAD-binding oxidoreductase, partial [Candidatus Omnitrophota bacterium]